MSTYHIPFPKNFLAVNTPVKKSTGATVEPTSPEADYGFLSNRPANVGRHQSVSSVSSDSTVMSAPASPPTKATAESPVLAAKVFTPLAVNTKHTLPPASFSDMTPVARGAFLSNRGAGF